MATLKIWPFDPTATGRVTGEQIVETAPGVFRIETPVPFPPGSVGALALADEIGGRPVWTLIDTGLASAEEHWRALLKGPLSGRPVGRVIATHHHPDHIGLAGWFQREHGAQLWTTRTAWLYARMLQLDSSEEPRPEVEQFYRRCGYDDAQMARQRRRSRVNFSVMVAPMPLGFVQIAEGDEITIGARRWRVEIGHGHAPEHALLVCDADGLLISGDQILPKITPNIGVYPTEPEADPLGAWLESCRRLAERLSDDLLTLPGHGPVFSSPVGRLRAVIDEHETALTRLEAHLATPQRVVDCFPALYARKIEGPVEGLATVETLAHLNRLRAAGRATRETDPDGAHVWRRASSG